MIRLFCLIAVILTLAACAPKPAKNTQTPPQPAPVVSPAPGVSSLPGQTPAPSPSLSPELTSTVNLPQYKTFISSGKGEKVTRDITTGDLGHFFSLEPSALLALLGGEYEDLGLNEDEGTYVYSYEYLNLTFFYHCIAPWEKPSFPLRKINVQNFIFQGLTPETSFAEIIKKLGETRIFKVPSELGFYYAMRYQFGKFIFEFNSGDQEGTDGIGLTVYPVIKYAKYYPINAVEIGNWFSTPKLKLIELLGSDYTAEEDESGISGVYNWYEYKGKGITLHFEQDQLMELYFDGRYRVGGEKKAETFGEIQKILGKGHLEGSEGDYVLTYTYKNFVIEFYSLEEDGYYYDMEIHSILQ